MLSLKWGLLVKNPGIVNEHMGVKSHHRTYSLSPKCIVVHVDVSKSIPV